ncbi:MAG: hypothetical protein JNJ80_22000 [Gemmatimonadetes bacterium]|nr:hypothetical protein [Gemmatimonadota bacterium]
MAFRWQRLAGLGLATLAAAATASAQAARPSKVDWPRIAELVVKRSLKLAPGERVILFWEQSADRGMAPALRTAIAAAGGVVAAELSAPTSADVEATRRLPAATQALQRARRDSV